MPQEARQRPQGRATGTVRGSWSGCQARTGSARSPSGRRRSGQAQLQGGRSAGDPQRPRRPHVSALWPGALKKRRAAQQEACQRPQERRATGTARGSWNGCPRASGSCTGPLGETPLGAGPGGHTCCEGPRGRGAARAPPGAARAASAAGSCHSCSGTRRISEVGPGPRVDPGRQQAPFEARATPNGVACALQSHSCMSGILAARGAPDGIVR